MQGVPLVADGWIQQQGQAYQQPAQGYQQPGYTAPAQQNTPAYAQQAQPSYQPQQAQQTNIADDMPEDDLPF